MRDSSWVIVCRETGNPVFETWNRSTVERINLEKYEAVPIMQWLARFNASVKAA